MCKLGIIPAAGVGKRWGYYPKFLLPSADKEWLLDRTIRAMPADQIVVTYGEDTGFELFRHIERCGLGDWVIFKENKEMQLGLYGSVLAGIEEEADYYYFGMPDTYWSVDVFDTMPADGISLGLHSTDLSQRFGMLRDGKIIDKQPGEPGLAWGVLGWSREVRDLWLSSNLESFTSAINVAMREFSWHPIHMDYYYDMASWFDYVHFIQELK